MRKIIRNHINFTEGAETLLFSAVSLLALGYWRSITIAYGWKFFMQPGWWIRFVTVSLLTVIPLTLVDGAWTRLREIMYPYNRRYGLYGKPLITRELNGLKTTSDRLNFAKNVSLTAIAIWVVIFAPLSDRTALIYYVTCLSLGFMLALFALAMALMEYIGYRSSH